jgi:sigma-E factor negative regulatory protein RseB
MNRWAIGKQINLVGWTALALSMLLWVSVVTAPGAYAAESSPETPETAVDWLERLGPALNMTSYKGVFVYMRGGQVHSMRIAHRFREGRVEERLVIQDGGSGEIVRKGMDVVCVLPDQGRVRLDDVIPSGPFAEAFAMQFMPVVQWYTPELTGEDRVAGYDTVTVALRAKDENRYSYRLWLEQDTGLLVKSHVLDTDGSVLEQFQFTSLEITDNIPDREFEVQTEGHEISRTLDGPENNQSPLPRMNGWTLDWRPEGFMPAAAPRSSKGKAVAFSDGLTAFSVFVEPAGKLKMPTGVSRVGATTIYMRQVDVVGHPFLIAVVGEIPPKTAGKLAEAVRINDDLALELLGP